MYSTNEIRAASALIEISNMGLLDIIPKNNFLFLQGVINNFLMINKKSLLGGTTWKKYVIDNTCRCTDYQPDFTKAENDYCPYCERIWSLDVESDGETIYQVYNIIN